MIEILQFLKELKENNNREWFEVNKSRYKFIQDKFNKFSEELIEGIESFDSSVKGVKLKDCIYRIYRDTRFSNNKEPYKTHIGAYICRGGKNSGYAGYYFHIEPQSSDFLGGNILAAGLHCPQPNVLHSVRDDIFSNGEIFEKALSRAKGFSLDMSNSLTRAPKGFPSDANYMQYIKLKEFSLMKQFSDDILLQNNLLDICLADFKLVKEYNDVLNRAVEYAYEVE